MPTLVNYSGDDDIYTGGSFYSNPVDAGLLFSIVSHVDVFCPPRKRPRRLSPVIFGRHEFEQEKKPLIDVLPDECLLEIFRRLPGGQERSVCACVSKKWLMLLSTIRKAERISKVETGETVETTDAELISIDKDGYLTRCLEGKKATDVRLAAIAVGAENHGGLGKLSIRGTNPTKGVTDFGLSAIARGCPSLKALSLWNVSSIGDDSLIAIANECHMLEKLDLTQCPMISDRSLIAVAEKCPNLFSLNVESCVKIGNEGLQAVGRFCSKLESISIKDCPLVGDLGIGSLLSSATSSMTKVKIQSLNITDTSLAIIGYYGKEITDLTLSGLQIVTEKGFWVMGNAQGLQKLTSLGITSCRGITDVSLEAIGKGCPNIKQTCLRKCCFMSDKGLVSFAKASSLLESLQLEECNRVTKVGIIGALSNCGSRLKSLALVKCMGIRDMPIQAASILTSCTSLRSLSIRNCPGFGSSGLDMVGKLCPKVQHLDLTGLHAITDTGLLPFLESCEEGLVKVNLGGCLQLSDKVVVALSMLHGGTLEVLNLDRCRKVTDASLEAISDNCHFLSELDVSNCAITDSGIAALCEALSLRILSLSACSKVSNKSVPFLCGLGKTLLGLNLQHCNSISSSSIEMLVDTLWRCDILY